MNKALILVDYEKEWIDKDSDYYVGDIFKVIEKTNTLIEHCRKEGIKIIFTRHVDEEFAGENSEIIDELQKKDSDIVITKNRISPFYKTTLQEHLNGIEQVIVCGILTNLCVRSLVHDAYDRDFEITVIKDCCVAFDDKTQEFTFKDLKATREEIEFVELREFL